MSVFVDAGVFYAHHDRDAPRHEAALGAFERLTSGEFGTIYTSDYIYDETVTLTLARTGSYTDAKAVGDRILGRGGFPDMVTVLHVSKSQFLAAVDTFETYHDQALSFTDATTVVLAERENIDAVLSFDDDFDGVVDRLDPAALAEQ